MRIKAAVLRQSGLPPPYATSKPLEIAELDLEPPGRGELLVAIKAAGLCHSDLSVIDGSRPRPTPMALGHEAAGIVEAVGEGVTDLKVGDHVVLVFVPSCGRCGPCAAGRPALCEPAAKANAAGTLLSGERRLSFRAEPVNHLLGVSAFAADPCGGGARIVREDRPRPAARTGGAVRLRGADRGRSGRQHGKARARAIGRGGRPRRRGLERRPRRETRAARQIVAVDLSDDKLAFATRLGATHAVNARSNDAVGDIGAWPAPASMSPSRWRARFRARARLCRDRPRRHDRDRRPAPSGQAHEPLAARAGRRGTDAQRLLCRLVDPQRDVPRMIALFRAGRLPVDALLTHRLKLDDINEGFDRLREGVGVRQVIVFD